MKNWLKTAWSWGTGHHPKDVLELDYHIPVHIRKMLIVIHGLVPTQAQFTHQVSDYQRIFQADYVFAPYFEQQNVGNLDAIAARHFDEEIGQIEPHLVEGARIIIVGMSNGGRIGMRVAEKLLDLPVHIDVFTIGSPLRGSALVGWLPKKQLVKKLGPELYQELLPTSTEAQQLAEVFQALLQNSKVTVRHVAGLNDQITNPPSNAYFPENEHVIIPGVDHGHLFTDPRTLEFLAKFVPVAPERPLEKDLQVGYLLGEKNTWFLFPKVHMVVGDEDHLPVPETQIPSIRRQLVEFPLESHPEATFDLWSISDTPVFVVQVPEVIKNPTAERAKIAKELEVGQYKHGFRIGLDEQKIAVLFVDP